MSEEKIIYKTSDKKSHWKMLFKPKGKNANLLGSHNLDPDEELQAEIKSISHETYINHLGKEEEFPMLHFTAVPSMILNRTNAKMLAKLYGRNHENWIGKTVQIFVDQNVRAQGGEIVEGLRIRHKKFNAEIDLKPHEDALRACKTSDELKAVFFALSPSIQKKVEKVKDEMKGKLS